MNMRINRGLLPLATLLAAQAATAQQVLVPNRTYELHVSTEDLGTFRDCAIFRGNGTLILEAGRNLVIDWALEPDPGTRRFQAVTDGSRAAANPIGLALHGTFSGTDRVSGEAINDRGAMFTFVGRVNRECELGSPYLGGNSPYEAAPSQPVLFEPSDDSVAGKLYDVRLYEGDVDDDCFAFVTVGTLVRNGGEQLVWRQQRQNERDGTFQAVGAPAGGSAGLALNGELTSWGELRVTGLRNDGRGLQAIVGSGRETYNCIHAQ
jgi:hypothetical protein